MTIEVNEKALYFLLGLFLIMGSILGWFGYQAYSEYQDFNKPSKTINGLWLPYDNYNNLSELEAIQKARDFDKVGNWVCVNIYGMSIKQMVDICQHEVAHEIFAQKCQNNVTKCLEAVQ